MKKMSKKLKRELKKKDKGIVGFIKSVNHFFEDLPKWINEMTDPRRESYINYTQSDLIMMGY